MHNVAVLYNLFLFFRMGAILYNCQAKQPLTISSMTMVPRHSIIGKFWPACQQLLWELEIEQRIYFLAFS